MIVYLAGNVGGGGRTGNERTHCFVKYKTPRLLSYVDLCDDTEKSVAELQFYIKLQEQKK